MRLPSPAEARRIMRTLNRATTTSAWWKAQKRDLHNCQNCGGKLAERWVALEHRRRLLCGKCGFIAYQNPKVVAATLPVRNGKIYLLRRNIEPSIGRWTFPAGYMELGETVEQAAIRETREEICCKVDLTRVHSLYSYPDSAVVTIVFEARVVGREPRPGEESQCVEAFRPSEIPWHDLAFRSTFQALYRWVQEAGSRKSAGGKR